MNTSATIPAALDGRLPDGEPVVVHVSGSSCRAGSGWSRSARPHERQHRAAAARPRRRRRRARSPAARVDLLAPFAGLAAAVARAARSAATGRSTTWPSTAARSATATSPATGRSTPTRRSSRASRAAPRCRARAGRSRPRSSPTSSARGVAHRAARCCTPACRRSRAASCRTPSATGCRATTAAAVNAVHARRRPCRRRRAPPSSARSRPSPTTTASCIPGEGWTEVVVTPERGVARGRRPAHRLARARGVAPADARGVRRPRRARDAPTATALDARVPVARVRRQPPVPAAPRTVTTMTPTPRRPTRRRCRPGRRAVLYAVRRRGEATAEQVAEQLGMTVSGARQHLTRARRRRARRGRRAAADRAASAAAARSRTRATADGRRAASPRPTASSPTSCSATSPTATPSCSTTSSPGGATHRIANAQARLAAQARPSGAKVAELTRILDEDGYLATYEKVAPGVVPRSSSTTARSGRSRRRYGQACTSEIDFIRAVLPDARRRARAAHGRRRPPLRLRDQSRARAESA